jgi:ERCC4-type nuclease
MKEIFDIFSKSPQKHRKQKPKDKSQKVICDYREKNCLVISELIHSGLEVDFKNLKVGDYFVNDVVIERKTVSDFISSMINRRLISQLKGLNQYKNRLLIIEGIDEQDLYSEEYSEEKMGIHPNSVRGFLLSIIIKYKVPIIFTKNYKDTAKFISILSKRKPKELSLNISRKTLDKKERLQFILEGFPGIGPKTAKKLLGHFKTLKNITNASKEELKEVIGKKADVLKKLLEQDY